MMTLVESLKRTWIAETGNSIPQLRARITSRAFHYAPLRTLPSISSLKYSSASQKLRTWRQTRILPECGVSCRAQKQQDGIPEKANPIPETEDILQGWQKVAISLFGFGVLLGPPLDAIHSRVQLQIYDRGAIDVAGLHTNIWVFPMLGVFYSSVGVLQLVLDKNLARKGALPKANLQKVVYSFIALAVLLEVSAEMYKAGVPFNSEAYILFALAELNWLVFDNTWWGFGLASLVGIACPLAEIPINKFFGLWHYPNGNIELFGESMVTWVLACYFFYTPFISNLARYLSSIYCNVLLQKRSD